MLPRDRVLRRLAVIFTVAGCTAPANYSALNDAYQTSIEAAAVKRPDYVRSLTPIDASQARVKVAHIQPYASIDSTRFIWVSLPDELRAFCRGRPDPQLAMQQALGLPPERRDDVRVFTFDVRPVDIFRPCASSSDITTSQCSLDLPNSPNNTQAVEHFVLKQMMDSYRTGFERPGYPFTGMGWSYDWDPASPTHQGVSEYVVKPGAAITDITSVSPASFCHL